MLSSISNLGNFVSQDTTDPCDICFLAKQTRSAFPSSSNKAQSLFQLIHCDIWGPYSIPSTTSASYFLSIIDDFFRATWVFMLAQKSEVA